MAVIYDTTMQPGKLELLSAWAPSQPWYRQTADPMVRAGGFRLDDPAGDVGLELIIVTVGSDAYFMPLSYRGEPLAGADAALLGTSEHGVLGTRWIYDGEQDPVLQAQLAALLRGEVVAQAQSESNTVDPSVVVRAAAAVTGVRINRLLSAAEPPPSGGYVAAPWRRGDGTSTRGVVAVAT
jgi:hypothetical protein